jgi:energy-coupling factor transport system substrate-specific component
MKIKVRELVLFGMFGSLLSASQIVLSFLPNIEVVTLFIILFSMIYKEKALYIVYIFVIVMGLIYGFGLWWFGYAALWPFLSILTYRLRKFIEGKYLRLAIYSGVFGLLFGFFYAIPNAIFVGLNAGIVYWIAGIQFDIIHGVGNYFIMIIFGEKLFDLVNKLNNKYLLDR